MTTEFGLSRSQQQLFKPRKRRSEMTASQWYFADQGLVGSTSRTMLEYADSPSSFIARTR